MSHAGAAPEQLALLLQAATHVWVARAQTEPEAQFAFEVQATQVAETSSQAGVSAEQSVSAVHPAGSPASNPGVEGGVPQLQPSSAPSATATNSQRFFSMEFLRVRPVAGRPGPGTIGHGTKVGVSLTRR